MSRVWSHRPRLSHLAIFFAAYVAGGGFAQALAIVPGTGISIWPPSGLYVATLIFSARQSWPWWVLTGFLAELFCNIVWFHNPLPVAVLIHIGNALEAMLGAWLVGRFGRLARLESLQEVLALVVLGAGVAPIASATVGSAILAWFGLQPFTAAWPLFWLGDATGVLIVAPLALVVLQNWRSGTWLSDARWMEACLLGLIFLGVAALSVSGHLASAYVVMPPLLWAAVRFEFRGAAVALALLTLITVVFTVSGASQFVGDAETQRQEQVMLQLFLVISAFSVLIVAAISRQHQQALLTLQRSEQQLQQTIDAVPVRIWSVKPSGGPVYFNKRYQDHFRSVLPDFETVTEPRIETLVQALAHPEDVRGVQETLQNCFETGEASVLRFRWREKDGEYRWAECRVAPRRNQDGVVEEWYGVSLDIDDEMRAQETLHDRERELAQLVDMLPAYIRRLTPDGRPIFFNKRLTDFIGMGLDDIDAVGTSRLEPAVLNYVHPDEAGGVVEAIRHAVATGEPYSMKYRMRGAEGVYRWIETRAEPLRNQDGTIAQWYSVSVDIDDEVRAQQSLRDRERELSTLVDMIPSHLWRVTPEGETTLANRHMAEFFGVDLENKQQIDEVFNTMFHPDEADEVAEVFGRSLRTGEPFSMNYRMRRHDGVYRWMSGRAVPMRDESGRVVQWFGLCHDIDDQVHAEEALRRASDKLARATQAASLAELSASIAHEVNQPLAAIVANSQACHRWLSADPPNVERAKITTERITRDANSAADVVSHIRALFRHTQHERSTDNINRLIDEAGRLMADEIVAKGIRLTTTLEPNLPSIVLDRIQVQQVMVNLMRNGIEAMEGVSDVPRLLLIRSRRDGPGAIRIEVSDSGMGFDDPDRALEPFFTTKQEGMGMGLAICRSIVEAHGGRLWAENNKLRGATVAFTLPLSASDT